MNNKNKSILKAKIEIKRAFFLKKIDEFQEGFYALFYFILKNPLENFWWEFISLTNQYVHLLIFIINKSVSNNKIYIIYIKIIVFSNLESRKIIRII